MHAGPPRWLLPLASLVVLTSCRNPCQQLCVEIRDYAATECGLQFTDAELDQCITNHKGSALDKGDRASCRDGRDQVDQEWDCGELEAYFSAQTGDGGAQGDSGVSAQ